LSRFLTASPRPSATESMLASDLGLLPHLQHATMGDSGMTIFIVHSTAGLLLCSKGHCAVQYYVCSPVSWQCLSLPELPWTPERSDGLLTVAANGDGIIRCFQVFLFNHPMDWHEAGGYRDLKVFSSDGKISYGHRSHMLPCY
jgi:hypothetical protein